MLYYAGLLVYIFFANLITSQFKSKNKSRVLFFLLTCLGVVLFQGYRSFSVGTDLASYIFSYLRIGPADFSMLTYLNYEPGYVLLNKLLYRCGLDERGFLIAITAIIQIPIFYTMYRHTEHPMISILWYFSFGNFIMTFSGLRQSIAMALCFAGYGLIRKKKIVLYCLLIFVAATFHTSALFCLILFPIYHIKLDKRGILVAIGLLAIVFELRAPIFAYLSKLYYGEARATSNTGAYTMFAILVLMLILSFLSKSEDSDYNGLRGILLLLAMIYSFASMHDYVARIGFPLSLYMTLFVPKLVDSFNVVPRKAYYRICGALLTASFFYLLGGLDTLPFSFG